MSQALIRRPWQAILAAILLFFLVLLISKSHVHSGIPSTLGFSQSGLSSPVAINQTLGFQQIFVVSLPERTDRRDSMILATALSDIKFDFIDAIHGDQVPDRAIPFGTGRSAAGGDSNIGSWRAHMNAISEVVRRNLTTALILEDDADWDIRIKDQLYDFSRSSRALIQPLASDSRAYADSTYPTPSSPDALPSKDLDFYDLPSTLQPSKSPYGDEWEMLWLGHCGMNFPVKGMGGDGRADLIPKGRVVRLDDQTVPETQFMYSVSEVKDLTQYPNHTRVVSHAGDGICSLGYAVTQASARRLSYHLGVTEITGQFDIMLKQFCDGTAGKGHHNCLTVRPGLFQHHRPAGLKAYNSDISDHGQEVRKKARSDNLRWPVRTNFDALLAGTTDYKDQFPDTAG